MEREHLPYADAIDRLGMLISRTFYQHKSGQIEKRDECIRRIDGVITQDMLFMDLIEDFFVYLEVLFESEKIDEFWHLMELMEPMINNLKVTSMQMRLLGLKIRFYRKHHMGAEYLQAAGLYYELSERKELEAKAMIKEVIELRANFEKVNQVPRKKLRRRISFLRRSLRQIRLQAWQTGESLIYRRMRCFRMLINVVTILLLRYWMWIISKSTMIITGIRRGTDV